MRFKLFLRIVACAVCSLLAACGGGGGDIEYLPVKPSRGDNWGFVDNRGKALYTDEFENKPSAVVGGVFSVKENGTYSLYKADKRPRLLCEGLLQVGYRSDGVIPVVRPGKRIELLDTDGKTVCELGRIGDTLEIQHCAPGFVDGILPVYAGGHWHYLNKSGREAFTVPPGVVYDHPLLKSPFQNGKYLFLPEKSNEATLMETGSNKALAKVPDKYTEVISFDGERILVKDADEHFVFLDTDMEVALKCADKVRKVIWYDKERIVVETGEGCGVIDFTGQTIIRAKYNSIAADEKDDKKRFFCHGGKKVDVTGYDGEPLKTLECKAAFPMPRFGAILALEDSHNWMLLDDDTYEETNKETYADLNLETGGLELIVSDYVDWDDVAKRAWSMLCGLDAAAPERGSSHAENPSLKSKNPRNYFKENRYTEKTENGARGHWSLEAKGLYMYSMAVGDGWYSYKWNPNSEFMGIWLYLTTDTEEHAAQLYEALQAQAGADASWTESNAKSKQVNYDDKNSNMTYSVWYDILAEGTHKNKRLGFSRSPKD